MSVIVRPPLIDDKENWLRLFAGYQKFYRAEIPTQVIETTWERIHDDASNVNALVAELNDRLVGITHYLFHDSTWDDRPSCYLEDLFVDKTARGSDAARKLIEGVESAARERNAGQLYLHTQAYNGAARSLYDSIMPPSSFVVYQKDL